MSTHPTQLIGCLLFLQACNTLPSIPGGRTVRTTNYPGGELKSVQEFIHGDVPDGRCIRYYRNGNVETEETYANGIKEGPFRDYHESGNLRSTAMFHGDSEEGEVLAFYEEGALRSSVFFREGWKVTPALTYYASGELQAAIAYEPSSNRVSYRADYDKDGRMAKEAGSRPEYWDQLVAQARSEAEAEAAIQRKNVQAAVAK